MKRALILLAIVESCQAAQIYFIGVCGDCEGNASATLTVTGFDPANPFTLTLSKFVSLSYAGTDLVPPFVIDSTNVTNVSGSLGPTYPRAYDVRIDAAPGTPSFVSFADGQWALSSGQGLDDLGTISSYSLTPVSTPEPGAAFVGAGVLLLAIASIRRRGRLRAACLPAAVIAVCSTHASTATISSFTTAEDGLVPVPGQSVTTPAGGPWNDLTFSWLFFALPGQKLVGGSTDAYVRKFSFAGTVLWTREFGTQGFDIETALTMGRDGLYVAGRTSGAFPGYSNAGSYYAFARKYDPTGNVLWTTQLETGGSTSSFRTQ